MVGACAAAQAADATRGHALYEARCAGCHSLEHDRVGPRHCGLIGRRAGTVAGFDYSRALRGSSVVWSADTLERWLADPEKLIAGQRMSYRVDAAADRADLVAYLESATSPLACRASRGRSSATGGPEPSRGAASPSS